MYTPPRKYLDLIRKGREPGYGDDTGHMSGGSDRYGTAGFEYENDPALAMRLTQVLVQQGYSDARIKHEHFKPSNRGFLWVRRHSDPDSASQGLLDNTDRSRKPMLDTRERHERILRLLRTGEIVSQKALIRAVGTARDSDTQNDLRELERMGAITVAVEQHGKVGWKRIYLSVSVPDFRTISYTIRRALARLIRRTKAMAKGFKRTSGGRQAKPMTPELCLEIDTENLPEPPMTMADVFSDMDMTWDDHRNSVIPMTYTHERDITDYERARYIKDAGPIADSECPRAERARLHFTDANDRATVLRC